MAHPPAVPILIQSHPCSGKPSCATTDPFYLWQCLGCNQRFCIGDIEGHGESHASDPNVCPNAQWKWLQLPTTIYTEAQLLQWSTDIKDPAKAWNYAFSCFTGAPGFRAYNAGMRLLRTALSHGPTARDALLFIALGQRNPQTQTFVNLVDNPEFKPDDPLLVQKLVEISQQPALRYDALQTRRVILRAQYPVGGPAGIAPLKAGLTQLAQEGLGQAMVDKAALCEDVTATKLSLWKDATRAAFPSWAGLLPLHSYCCTEQPLAALYFLYLYVKHELKHTSPWQLTNPDVSLTDFNELVDYLIGSVSVTDVRAIVFELAMYISEHYDRRDLSEKILEAIDLVEFNDTARVLPTVTAQNHSKLGLVGQNSFLEHFILGDAVSQAMCKSNRQVKVSAAPEWNALKRLQARFGRALPANMQLTQASVRALTAPELAQSTHLRLVRCNVDAMLPSLVNLRSLECFECVPGKAVTNLSALTELKFEGGNLDWRSLTNNMPHLASLSLVQVPLVEFKGWPALRSLTLNDCSVQRVDLSASPNLECLSIVRASSAFTTLTPLASLPLRTVVLDSIAALAGAFTVLQGLNQLRDLTLSGVAVDGSADIFPPSLERLVINVKKLNLRHITKLSNLTFLDIAKCEIAEPGAFEGFKTLQLQRPLRILISREQVKDKDFKRARDRVHGRQDGNVTSDFTAPA